MKRAAFAAPLFWLCGLVAGPARALAPPPQAEAPTRRDEARALAQRGDDQFDVGRCDKAIDLWKEAEAKFHAPTILLRVARCQALLGRVVEAAATLEAITRDELGPGAPPPFAEAKRVAERELDGVRARIATLTITIDRRQGVTRTPTLDVDDRPVPNPGAATTLTVDPGHHVVRVRAGEATWSRVVTVGDGELQALRIALFAEPPPAPSLTSRHVGLFIGGAGLAALSVGVGFGASALSTSGQLDARCGADRRQCPSAEQPTIDRLRAHALVADLSLAGSAAFIATSAMLLLLDPRPRPEPSRVRISASAWTLGGGPSTLSVAGAGLSIAGAF